MNTKKIKILPFIHVFIFIAFLALAWNIQDISDIYPITYFWLKAMHIISIICWFAMLFYLPRLFVYHATKEGDIAIDEAGHRRFCVMEYKLYHYIGTPAMMLTIVFGILLTILNSEMYLKSPWFHAKLTLIFVLVFYHIYCGKVVRNFAKNSNTKTHRFYRAINEIPTLILIAVIILIYVVRYMT